MVNLQRFFFLFLNKEESEEFELFMRGIKIIIVYEIENMYFLLEFSIYQL